MTAEHFTVFVERNQSCFPFASIQEACFRRHLVAKRRTAAQLEYSFYVAYFLQFACFSESGCVHVCDSTWNEAASGLVFLRRASLLNIIWILSLLSVWPSADEFHDEGRREAEGTRRLSSLLEVQLLYLFHTFEISEECLCCKLNKVK